MAIKAEVDRLQMFNPILLVDNQNGQPIILGKSLEDISSRIKESYPQIVSIYRGFLLKLMTDPSIAAVNPSDLVDVIVSPTCGQLAQQLGE